MEVHGSANQEGNSSKIRSHLVKTFDQIKVAGFMQERQALGDLGHLLDGCRILAKEKNVQHERKETTSLIGGEGSEAKKRVIIDEGMELTSPIDEERWRQR